SSQLLNETRKTSSSSTYEVKRENENKEDILPNRTVHRTSEYISQTNIVPTHKEALDMIGSHAITEKEQNTKERSNFNDINPVKEKELGLAPEAQLTNSKVSDKSMIIGEKKFSGNGVDHSQHDAHNANINDINNMIE